MIEQAKGLLIGQYRIDPDRAFEMLSRCSSRIGVKVRELATQLVQAASTPSPTPFDPSHELTGAHDQADLPNKVKTRDA